MPPEKLPQRIYSCEIANRFLKKAYMAVRVHIKKRQMNSHRTEKRRTSLESWRWCWCHDHSGQESLSVSLRVLHLDSCCQENAKRETTKVRQQNEQEAKKHDVSVRVKCFRVDSKSYIWWQGSWEPQESYTKRQQVLLTWQYIWLKVHLSSSSSCLSPVTCILCMKETQQLSIIVSLSLFV